MLVALVLIVWAFLGGGDRRPVMLATGVALGCLAGLELAVREHFTGFRSHTSILAGACTVALGVALTLLLHAPQIAVLAVGVVCFGLCFAGFRAAFKRRSGGLGFRA